MKQPSLLPLPSRPRKQPPKTAFDPATAFNARMTDPDTSHAATARIRHTDKAQVFAAFKQAAATGRSGLTDRELQARCPESSLSRLESWRKRRSDLAREGALVDTGTRRQGQIVWAERKKGEPRCC